MPNNSCKKAKALRTLKKERKGHVVAADRAAAQQRLEESLLRRGRRPGGLTLIRA